MAVDLRNRHIIYYDPKSKDPRDVTLANNIPLVEVIRKLGAEFIPPREDAKLKVYYNTQKHQHESHNCGIFVLIFLQRLLETDGVQGLRTDQFFDYSQTIERDRKLLLDTLTPYA